jgi:hypothetical protein
MQSAVSVMQSYANFLDGEDVEVESDEAKIVPFERRVRSAAQEGST